MWFYQRFYFMRISVLPECVYVCYMPLELQLQVILSYHEGAGSHAQTLYKSNKCTELLTPPSGPLPLF